MRGAGVAVAAVGFVLAGVCAFLLAVAEGTGVAETTSVERRQWNAVARINGSTTVVTVESETVEFVDTGDLGACVRFSNGGRTVALLCGVEAVASKEGTE